MRTYEKKTHTSTYDNLQPLWWQDNIKKGGIYHRPRSNVTK